MTHTGLHGMMKMFERTEKLGILPGRGRHDVDPARVDVTSAVVEATSQSPHGVVSLPTVSCITDISSSTVCEVMRRILGYYAYKILSFQELTDLLRTLCWSS
ncbi:hypothetical protein NPIL_271421 [Nephila pilipes]|uniref:Uncharacterized protein n=1 Tax=Nephila pilipes TaxID=299642 RepID=A0A8X6N6F1_NEPPI|nr:hypothetical protein NPIL_271421 [Nephila pilipes]